MELRRLVPSEGHILYNGEILTKEVYLGCNDSPDNWQEITEEEANAIMGVGEATVADYREALKTLGVNV